MTELRASHDDPRVAILIGEPNGIGAELAVRTVQHARTRALDPIVVGDEYVVREAEHVLGLGGAPVRTHDVPALAREAFAPGRLDPCAGRAAIAYLEAAVALHARGEIDAIL